MATPPEADLPPVEFAFPGPLRDQLVAAIDSAGRPVLVLESTAVEIRRLADVPLAHAVDEGEGFTTVAEWRAGHEEFWTSPEVLAEPSAGFRLDDDSEIVMERFRVVR